MRWGGGSPISKSDWSKALEPNHWRVIPILSNKSHPHFVGKWVFTLVHTFALSKLFTRPNNGQKHSPRSLNSDFGGKVSLQFRNSTSSFEIRPYGFLFPREGGVQSSF
ncbi:hypothetical protein CDAR_457651 [Caerostris darwini]|uniref:Uncharacterized protein n=1 Tax=Caerostris darwini TaxID=1538125 RepID=A0AAV4N7Q5_9ARAC|nr:hypothetical protein CDAR_457651 [Caerostris darwini]